MAGWLRESDDGGPIAKQLCGNTDLLSTLLRDDSERSRHFARGAQIYSNRLEDYNPFSETSLEYVGSPIESP